MRALGIVLRTVILWVISVVAAVAVMEGAHRIELARDRGGAATLEAQAPVPEARLLSTLPAGTTARPAD